MIEEIKNLPVLSSLDSDELNILYHYMKRDELVDGTTFALNENSKKNLYLVTQGKLVTTIQLPGSMKQKAGEYKRGDIFGVTSFFTESEITEQFSCEGDCVLYFLDRSKIDELINEHSAMAVKILPFFLSNIIERFRNSSEFLADIVQWGENASRRVITDELTGIYNRRFLDDALRNFFDISKENKKPLSLFMLDLDNFRELNNQYGSEIGDSIIREVSTIISHIVSKYGIIARFGGDEFAVLLPEANGLQAKDIAEKIRLAVRNHDFSKLFTSEDKKITASIGISTYPETAKSFAEFKEVADNNLYEAKNNGRDCVR